MFDLSFTELMLAGVVALIVIGPEKLPKVARTVGHLLGRAQRYVNDVKGDIQREVELDELRKMKQEMDSAAQSMKSSLSETESELRKGLQEPLDQIKSLSDGLEEDLHDASKDNVKDEPQADLKEQLKDEQLKDDSKNGATEGFDYNYQPGLTPASDILTEAKSAQTPSATTQVSPDDDTEEPAPRAPSTTSAVPLEPKT